MRTRTQACVHVRAHRLKGMNLSLRHSPGQIKRQGRPDVARGLSFGDPCITAQVLNLWSMDPQTLTWGPQSLEEML